MVQKQGKQPQDVRSLNFSWSPFPLIADFSLRSITLFLWVLNKIDKTTFNQLQYFIIPIGVLLFFTLRARYIIKPYRESAIQIEPVVYPGWRLLSAAVAILYFLILLVLFYIPPVDDWLNSQRKGYIGAGPTLYSVLIAIPLYIFYLCGPLYSLSISSRHVNVLQSPPHLFLLTTFLRPRLTTDVPVLNESQWSAFLGEPVADAIRRLLTSKLIELSPLNIRLSHITTVTQLRQILSSRGLSHGGRKDELILKLIRADSKQALALAGKSQVYQCTSKGRDIAESYLLNLPRTLKRSPDLIARPKYISSDKLKELLVWILGAAVAGVIGNRVDEAFVKSVQEMLNMLLSSDGEEPQTTEPSSSGTFLEEQNNEHNDKEEQRDIDDINSGPHNAPFRPLNRETVVSIARALYFASSVNQGDNIDSSGLSDTFHAFSRFINEELLDDFDWQNSTVIDNEFTPPPNDFDDIGFQGMDFPDFY